MLKCPPLNSDAYVEAPEEGLPNPFEDTWRFPNPRAPFKIPTDQFLFRSASLLFGSWSIIVYKLSASRKLLNVNKGPVWIVFFAVKYNSPPVKQIALLEFQPYVTCKLNTFGHAFMEFNMLI